MTLIKTSLLSFIANIVKMIAGLVINKAVAVYIGPSGLALVGQFHNFTQITMMFAKGGINPGVTKYIAEYKGEKEKIYTLLSTAAVISLACCVFVAFLLIFLSTTAAAYLLNSVANKYVFEIFAITISLFVFNQLVLSILNGLKEIRSWISINIIQSLVSLVLTTVLIVVFGLDGALIALVTNQSVVFIISLLVLKDHPVIKLHNFLKKFNTEQARGLFKFSLMSLVSAAALPLSLIILRNYISEELDWESVGYWQGVWYISSMYLTVITTTLGIYFLPRFAEIDSAQEIRKEVLNGYKLILPVVCALASLIFIFRDVIIVLLFSKDFLAMRELFLWQLIGDLVKVSAWLLGYLIMAKGMTKTFIINEVIFSGSFVLISVLLVNQFGLVGVTYAYTINYFLYLLSLFISVRKII